VSIATAAGERAGAPPARTETAPVLPSTRSLTGWRAARGDGFAVSGAGFVATLAGAADCVAAGVGCGGGWSACGSRLPVTRAGATLLIGVTTPKLRGCVCHHT